MRSASRRKAQVQPVEPERRCVAGSAPDGDDAVAVIRAGRSADGKRWGIGRTVGRLLRWTLAAFRRSRARAAERAIRRGLTMID